MSFGTGQHPTTLFCLEQLAACRAPGEPQAFLDIGTGSGILAIAAAKLDYHPVVAIDYDDEAIRVARSNARRNHVLRRIQFLHMDMQRFGARATERFDVICANLTIDLFLDDPATILDRLKLGGALVMAGILKTQFAFVQDLYTQRGLRLIRTRSEKEWKSGLFRV